MSETATKEKVTSTTIKEGEITFLPYMCENAPRFNDIDAAVRLMRGNVVSHKQREIWKMMPKKDKEGKLVRDEKTGVIVMIKVVTRNSKVVTVMEDGHGGLRSVLTNGKTEPMDYTDLKEVLEALNKQQQ